jgi:hypothetical protein
MNLRIQGVPHEYVLFKNGRRVIKTLFNHIKLLSPSGILCMYYQHNMLYIINYDITMQISKSLVLT